MGQLCTLPNRTGKLCLAIGLKALGINKVTTGI